VNVVLPEIQATKQNESETNQHSVHSPSIYWQTILTIRQM
jgi:hypothetical protein